MCHLFVDLGGTIVFFSVVHNSDATPFCFGKLFFVYFVVFPNIYSTHIYTLSYCHYCADGLKHVLGGLSTDVCILLISCNPISTLPTEVKAWNVRLSPNAQSIVFGLSVGSSFSVFMTMAPTNQSKPLIWFMLCKATGSMLLFESQPSSSSWSSLFYDHGHDEDEDED